MKNTSHFSPWRRPCSPCRLRLLDRFRSRVPSTGTFPAASTKWVAGVLAAYKSLANNIEQYGSLSQQVMGPAHRHRRHAHGAPEMAGLHPVHHHLVVQRRRAFHARITRASDVSTLVLDNLDNLGKIEDEEYYRLKAVLLSAGSFLYDWACKVYGDVPFIDHCLTLDDWRSAFAPRKRR